MTTTALALLTLTALAGAGALAAFRSGARGAYTLARQTQEVTRAGTVAAHALVTMSVIVGVQWTVLRLTTDPRAWAVTLAVPALFAGASIARMFSVTEIIHPGADHHRKGARR